LFGKKQTNNFVNLNAFIFQELHLNDCLKTGFFKFFLAHSGGMGKDQRSRTIGAIRYDGTRNGFDESDASQGSETGFRWDAISNCQS
jgi:hypothetical protein